MALLNRGTLRKPRWALKPSVSAGQGYSRRALQATIIQAVCFLCSAMSRSATTTRRKNRFHLPIYRGLDRLYDRLWTQAAVGGSLLGFSIDLLRYIYESSHGVGVALVEPKKGIPCVRLRSSREELAVSHLSSNFTSTYRFRTLRHRSLVGLCERMPSKSFVGGDISSSSCEELRDGLLLPCRGMALGGKATVGRSLLSFCFWR